MKHLCAILLLPFMVTVVLPATILWPTEPNAFGLQQSLPGRVGLSVVGVALSCSGITLLVATIRLFAIVGQGTRASWNSTQRLVVQGVCRHIRNPMLSGVMGILFGDAVPTASLPLVCQFSVFVVVNAVYIPLAQAPNSNAA